MKTTPVITLIERHEDMIRPSELPIIRANIEFWKSEKEDLYDRIVDLKGELQDVHEILKNLTALEQYVDSYKTVREYKDKFKE